MRRSGLHCTTSVLALLAALGAALHVPAASAEDGLGRLFYSAEARAGLDRLRQARHAPEFAGGADGALRLDGIALSGSGRQRIWLNGTLADDAQALRVEAHDRPPGTLILRAGGPAARRLRVGETLAAPGWQP